MARLLSEHGSSVADLVVVVDDVALALGRLRVRERGSHGGHNGLRSLIDGARHRRVRARAGRRRLERRRRTWTSPTSCCRSSSPEDVLVVQEVIGLAADAVACLVQEGAAAAMNRFNGPRA